MHMNGDINVHITVCIALFMYTCVSACMRAYTFIHNEYTCTSAETINQIFD